MSHYFLDIQYDMFAKIGGAISFGTCFFFQTGFNPSDKFRILVPPFKIAGSSFDGQKYFVCTILLDINFPGIPGLVVKS